MGQHERRVGQHQWTSILDLQIYQDKIKSEWVKLAVSELHVVNYCSRLIQSLKKQNSSDTRFEEKKLPC